MGGQNEDVICMYIHTYIHTYTHTRTHIHTCIHTHIRVHIHTCMHTCAHTYAFKYFEIFSCDDLPAKKNTNLNKARIKNIFVSGKNAKVYNVFGD